MNKHLRLPRLVAAALALASWPLSGLMAHATPAQAPNELGRVPVLEYHRFGPKEDRWTRTYDNFRKDLAWLHANGYVTVNAKDLADGKLEVPAGKKPVVFTFDDATAEQFKFLHDAGGKVRRDAKGQPMVDPQSAVGIMDAFYAQHPDFGRAGTFYVLPNPFEVAAESGDKLRYLLATGREVGNHTYNHGMLKKMSPNQITNEMVKAQNEVVHALGRSYSFSTLALPFGIYPKDEAGTQAVIAGGAQGQAYRHTAVFLVGADPSPSPFDKKYNAMKVPRIQAIDDEWKRHFRRPAGFVGVNEEAFRPYVSDGNPATVTFPSKLQDRLNPRAVGNRKTVQLSAAAGTVLGGGGPSTPAPAAPAATAPMRVHPGYANAALPAGGEYVGGKIFHTVQKGQDPTDLANMYLAMTDYYTRPSLEKALLSKNGLKGWIPVGKRIEIPGVRASAVVPKRVPKPRTFDARGIYVTQTSAGTERVFTLVNQMKPHGLNTVVFDVKDMDGHLAYDSRVPLAVSTGASKGAIIRDVPKLVDRLHRQGVHVVARQALFHDAFLAQRAPRLALKSKSGKPWREKGKLVWVDPNNPEVRAYNLGITKELLAMGVDEIQYDYIRFPAMGAMQDINYSFDTTKTPKHAIITGYLKEAYQVVKPTGALLSLDVFGVVAWDEGVDVKHTGQRIEDLAKYADVISPMVYPSHFYPPFLGHKSPANEPYYFVNEGVKRTMKKTAGTGIVVRPWLQAFKFMVRGYGPEYVATQIKANDDAKGIGYLLWNAGNNYDIGLQGVSSVEKTKAALKKPV
ncbi:MAG TPA: putative glycoside hydrolase [Pantanalinema sp.]